MRRFLCLLVLVLVPVAFAGPGCGGGGDDGRTSAAPEDAVRETAERFLASAAQGDGREACELTDQAFRETVAADCPAGLTDIYAGEVPDVRSVDITGSRATARLSSPPPDDAMTLVLEGGQWRVLLSGE